MGREAHAHPGERQRAADYQTSAGALGTLPCVENTNTLARFALLAQGELVHVANYPASPYPEEFDLVSAIKLRAGAHSFEGKVFTVAVSSPLGADAVDLLCDTDERRELLAKRPVH